MPENNATAHLPTCPMWCDRRDQHGWDEIGASHMRLCRFAVWEWPGLDISVERLDTTVGAQATSETVVRVGDVGELTAGQALKVARQLLYAAYLADPDAVGESVRAQAPAVRS